MKTLLVLLVVLLAGCGIGAQDSAARLASETRWYLQTMPVGAELLEVIPSADDRYGYAIIKFRDECFIQHSRGTARAMANINCPTGE